MRSTENLGSFFLKLGNALTSQVASNLRKYFSITLKLLLFCNYFLYNKVIGPGGVDHLEHNSIL